MTLSRVRPWLVLAVFVGLSSAALGNQPHQRHAWWKAEPIVKELGLTAEQSARIEEIFQSMRVEARQELEELERLETKLSRMIQSDAGEGVVVRQIDRVETARANLSKTRSLMLLRMRQVLSPEQRLGLTEIQKRAAQAREGGPRPVPEHRR